MLLIKKFLLTILFTLVLSGSVSADNCVSITDHDTKIMKDESNSSSFPYIEISWKTTYLNECNDTYQGMPKVSILDKDGFLIEEEIQMYIQMKPREPITAKGLITLLGDQTKQFHSSSASMVYLSKK